MDAIKDQFERVRQQLATLTASQRMVVGLLVAAMAVTVLWWGKYAGQSDMVPVLDQQLSDEDIGPITRRLDLAGVPHSVAAGKVLVPADRKAEILADLMYSQDLPRDTHWAFEDMTAKELNPFSSDSERRAVYNHATELELTGVIRRWPGVADARVVINAASEQRIGQSIDPTATVSITTARGRGPADEDALRQLVQAAADGVTGAVSRLTQKNVRVIVDGKSRPVRSAADGSGLVAGDTLELQEKNEAFLEQKVREELSFINGLTVAVTCDVANSTRVDNDTSYNKAGAFTEDTYQRNTTSEQRSADPAGPEVGAASNTGTANVPADAVAAGGGGAVGGSVTTNNSTSDETTGSQSFVPHHESTTTTGSGKASVQSASVCIPMSYVVKVARSSNPAVRDPSAADLDRAKASAIAMVRDLVTKALYLTVDRVSIATFADDAGSTADLTLAAATAPAPQQAPGVLASHGKEIAIGTLALVSLGMMLHLARRESGSVTLPNPSLVGLSLADGGIGDADDEDDEQQDDRSPIAADIGSTSSLLGGMAGVELDEETLRTQQMLDQVSTLVKEDPDAAAALVKRWVTRA